MVTIRGATCPLRFRGASGFRGSEVQSERVEGLSSCFKLARVVEGLLSGCMSSVFRSLVFGFGSFAAIPETSRIYAPKRRQL